jgi:hypothetical protein
MRNLLLTALALMLTAPLFAHQGDHVRENEVFTLYRSSIFDGTMRIHVATFDAKAGTAYNEENCAVARDLFRNQPGVTVAYWCEAGYVKDAD